MSLYSYKNNHPQDIPERIRLSNGLTRTDPSTFTEEELIDAGYIKVENPPEYDPEYQKLIWAYDKWSIVQKTEDDIDKEKNYQLAKIREDRKLIIEFIEKRIKINKIQKILDLYIDDSDQIINSFDLYLQKLREMPDQEDPSKSWPVPPINLKIETVKEAIINVVDKNENQQSAIIRGKKEKVREKRTALINDTMCRIYRCQSQIRLGIEPDEDLEKLFRYVQDLADITKQQEFPDNVVWPLDPLLDKSKLDGEI